MEEAQQRAAQEVARAREEAAVQAAAEAARVARQAQQREAEYEERRHAEVMLRMSEHAAEREEAERRLRLIEERANEAVRAAKEEARVAAEEAQRRVEELQRRQAEREAEVREARAQLHSAQENVREFESQRSTSLRNSPSSARLVVPGANVSVSSNIMSVSQHSQQQHQPGQLMRSSTSSPPLPPSAPARPLVRSNTPPTVVTASPHTPPQPPPVGTSPSARRGHVTTPSATSPAPPVAAAPTAGESEAASRTSPRPPSQPPAVLLRPPPSPREVAGTTAEQHPAQPPSTAAEAAEDVAVATVTSALQQQQQQHALPTVVLTANATNDLQAVTDRLIRAAIREAVREILGARDHARLLREDATRRMESSQQRYRRRQAARDRAAQDLVDAESSIAAEDDAEGVDVASSMQFGAQSSQLGRSGNEESWFSSSQPHRVAARVEHAVVPYTAEPDQDNSSQYFDDEQVAARGQRLGAVPSSSSRAPQRAPFPIVRRFTSPFAPPRPAATYQPPQSWFAEHHQYYYKDGLPPPSHNERVAVAAPVPRHEGGAAEEGERPATARAERQTSPPSPPPRRSQTQTERAAADAPEDNAPAASVDVATRRNAKEREAEAKGVADTVQHPLPEPAAVVVATPSPERAPPPSATVHNGDGHADAEQVKDNRSSSTTASTLPQPDLICRHCYRDDTTSPCWSCGEIVCRECGVPSGRRKLCCVAHHRELLRAHARAQQQQRKGLEQMARKALAARQQPRSPHRVSSGSDEEDVDRNSQRGEGEQVEGVRRASRHARRRGHHHHHRQHTQHSARARTADAETSPIAEKEEEEVPHPVRRPPVIAKSAEDGNSDDSDSSSSAASRSDTEEERESRVQPKPVEGEKTEGFPSRRTQTTGPVTATASVQAETALEVAAAVRPSTVAVGVQTTAPPTTTTASSRSSRSPAGAPSASKKAATTATSRPSTSSSSTTRAKPLHRSRTPSTTAEEDREVGVAEAPQRAAATAVSADDSIRGDDQNSRPTEEPKTEKKAAEAFFVPFGDSAEPRRPKPPTPCNYVPMRGFFRGTAPEPAHPAVRMTKKAAAWAAAVSGGPGRHASPHGVSGRKGKAEAPWRPVVAHRHSVSPTPRTAAPHATQRRAGASGPRRRGPSMEQHRDVVQKAPRRTAESLEEDGFEDDAMEGVPAALPPRPTPAEVIRQRFGMPSQSTATPTPTLTGTTASTTLSPPPPPQNATKARTAAAQALRASSSSSAAMPRYWERHGQPPAGRSAALQTARAPVSRALHDHPSIDTEEGDEENAGVPRSVTATVPRASLQQKRGTATTEAREPRREERGSRPVTARATVAPSVAPPSVAPYDRADPHYYGVDDWYSDEAVTDPKRYAREARAPRTARNPSPSYAPAATSAGGAPRRSPRHTVSPFAAAAALGSARGQPPALWYASKEAGPVPRSGYPARENGNEDDNSDIMESPRRVPTLAELDRRLRQLREQDAQDVLARQMRMRHAATVTGSGGVSGCHAARHGPPSATARAALSSRASHQQPQSYHPSSLRPTPTVAYDPTVTVVVDLPEAASARRAAAHAVKSRSRSRSQGKHQQPRMVSPPWRTDLNASPVRPPWNYKQPRSPLYQPPLNSAAFSRGAIGAVGGGY